MMKKNLHLLVTSALLLLTACTESNYEMHQTYFYPQHPGGMNFFADQLSDTVHIVSFDSWTARSATSWISVSPESEEVPAGYIGDTRLTIKTEANTTGKNRSGFFEVKSYSNIGMAVNQSHWLNIEHPRPIYNAAVDFSDKVASFKMDVFAHTADTTITFTVYQNAATLVSDADWFVPKAGSFEKGKHEVSITVTPNTSNQERTAKLTLTSGGISTPIQIIQQAKKEE